VSLLWHSILLSLVEDLRSQGSTVGVVALRELPHLSHGCVAHGVITLQGIASTPWAHDWAVAALKVHTQLY